MKESQKKLVYVIAACLLAILTIIFITLAILLRSKTEDIKTTPSPAPQSSQTDQTTADVLESGKFKAEVKINPTVAPEQ